MKKIFSIAILFAATALVLTGCKNEEDNFFDGSAAERLMQAQQIYTQRLGNTTWVMEYYPLDYTDLDPDSREPYPAGLGYVILNRFKSDCSVEQAMQNSVSKDKYLNDISVWEVIGDQGPVLSFNTFNKCIHAFADPGVNETSKDLYQGRGYEGDYEFGVLSLEEGAPFCMLKGKKRGTYVRMSRLPNETDFKTYMQDIIDFQKMLFEGSPTGDVIALGDTTFMFTRGDKGIAELYPVGGDAITENSWHPYLITKRDGKYYMRFREKIPRGNCDAQEFVYDAAQDMFVGVENSAYTITGYAPGKFFGEYIQNKPLTIKTDGEMSASFKQLMDDFAAELKKVNKNFVFTNINFSLNSKESKYQWIMSYLSSGKVANQAYYFDYSANGDACTFNYTGASTTAAQNVINKCPALKTLWDNLSQEWQITAADSKFNLKRIKLTSKTDANLWFVVTI